MRSRLCFLYPNLVPRAYVSFGQHQDTELWNNQFPETKIRHGCDGSSRSSRSRSVDIFPTHCNTTLHIFQDSWKLTNGHESTPSVTVATGHRDLSIANWQTVTKRHHHDDPPTCPKLTHRDEPSWSVANRHQFGDPLRIGRIGQPWKVIIQDWTFFQHTWVNFILVHFWYPLLLCSCMYDHVMVMVSD